ncbi:MAG: SRPBCC domain-containing protein [Chloroflexi bacterium]|nr:SRPBCC domain-containing protein [Chloroflexota bacterium]
MTTTREPKAKQMTSDLVITRTFDAPRELVWKAWTEPERLMRWWGPKGFTAPACKIDLRVGGKYVNCMRSPDGKDYWSTGVYREIVPMERIVCTDSFADEKGNVVPGSHYGMGEDFPLEMVVTMTLEEVGGKTRMTLRHGGMPAGEHSEGAGAGWNESFDKLAEVLATRTSTMSNPVTWFEIIGKDAVRLQKFYGDVFGWKLSPPMPEMGNYSLLDNEGKGIAGGIGEGGNGDSSRVTIYIEVEDPQASLDRVTRAGGTMLMPVTKVTEGVTIAMFADPEGHVIGLLKSNPM